MNCYETITAGRYSVGINQTENRIDDCEMTFASKAKDFMRQTNYFISQRNLPNNT